MFPVYKPAALLLVWSCTVFAADGAVSGPDCAGSLCVLNVNTSKLIAPPCSGYSVLVGFSKSSGATLIQCSKFAAAGENITFVYDRRNLAAKAFEFHGGRFVRSTAWARMQTGGVPDTFGQVPLCAVSKRETPAEGQLLIVEKEPQDSETAPYCYRVYYVVAGQNGLTIHGDSGKDLSPLSTKAAAEWTRLRENLARYIR